MQANFSSTGGLRAALRAGIVGAALLLSPTLSAQQDAPADEPFVITPSEGYERARRAGTLIPGTVPGRSLHYAPAPASAEITLERIMSPDQIRAIGLDKLTDVQRAEFARWLSRYSESLMRTRRPAPVERYSGGHVVRNPARHTVGIEANVQNGSTIVLADGGIWEIYLSDRPESATWEPGQHVLVRRAAVGIDGEYDYELYNGRRGDWVRAKFGGVFESFADAGS